MNPEQNNIREAWSLNVKQRLSEKVPKKVSRREQNLGNRGKTPTGLKMLYDMEA